MIENEKGFYNPVINKDKCTNCGICVKQCHALKIILASLTDTPFTINHGDRIAQMVFAKVEKIDFEEVDSISDTKRGEGGFGSTNK